MARPINDVNAIDSAAFVLGFARPFLLQEIELLGGVEQVLRSDLPVSNRLNRLQIQLTNAPQSMSENFASNVESFGLHMQRFLPDGRPEWDLRVWDDSVVVTCRKYSSWSSESSDAIRFIQTVARVLERGENIVAMVALQITDRFVGEAGENYKVASIFKEDSPYLTEKAKSSGALWHVFQGWFSDASEHEARCLHVLNLSANLESVHVTNIEHTGQLQFSEPLHISAIAAGDKLKSLFGWLHDQNVSVICDVLNENQQRAVGLI